MHISSLPSLIEEVAAAHRVVWKNPRILPAQAALSRLTITSRDVERAAERWERLRLVLPRIFGQRPNGAPTRIDSPLRHIRTQLDALAARTPRSLVLVKCDHELPITGCVKERGAFYELFSLAENLACEAGFERDSLIESDNSRSLFMHHTVVTGSTGNLGFSVGLIGRALGFHAEVHMSRDAKTWKKRRLQDMGVTVVEHSGDYSAAVTAARISAVGEAQRYFVDDEHSLHLFLGYALGAIDLKRQLDQMDVFPSAATPLFVYIPCGVGGAPSGITFGLKLLFGEAVVCIFVEPVQSPSMLLQLANGLDKPISVYEIGLKNMTAADGLAVGSASLFAATQCEHLVDFCVTVNDDDLFYWLNHLWKISGVRLEPSAAAGFAAASSLMNSMQSRRGLASWSKQFSGAIHVIWTTGGSHLPETEHEALLARADRPL